MFAALEKLQGWQMMQSKNTMQRKKQAADVYTTRLQTRLNKLVNLVATSLAAMSSLVEAVSNSSPNSETKASGGNLGLF